MEIMDICIDKIIKVEERRRVVVVTMDTSTYGGHVKGEVYGFFKEKWPEIERRMSFPETCGLDQRDIERYENMPDEEWYKRKYTKELRDFSDEEIAAEFNRRINSPVFHNLTVEVKAVVANRR